MRITLGPTRSTGGNSGIGYNTNRAVLEKIIYGYRLIDLYMVTVLDTPWRLVIDGELVETESSETYETVDPSTGEHLADVARGRAEDIDRAVESGRHAFEEWRSYDPEERGRVLLDVADAIRDAADELAELEARDVGKPLSQSREQAAVCARYFEYYAGAADKIHGEQIPQGGGYLDWTVREPLGVTGQIIPWNFPMELFGRIVAPALAAGNAAVAKPSEQTPRTAIAIGHLSVEAGLPPGLLNVVPGYGSEAGAALASHADIDGMSFIGSVETGLKVGQSAVGTATPVNLELGGKSPIVVYPDADYENALENTITAIFGNNSGQVCAAGSRLLVHEDIHDSFVADLCERAADLEIGPAMEDPDMGPLATESQFEKVKQYVTVGRSEVGEPATGGTVLERDGFFVEPTVFDGVDNDMRIAQEEIFGPVLSVISFTTEAEAIELANDIRYGLVAGVFTSDMGKATRFARAVQAGQVYINEYYASGIEAPFGGYKQSGFGRENGLEALENYTQTKNVCAKIDL
jgi:aldehyde dehydrogenase (NAD+)